MEPHSIPVVIPGTWYLADGSADVPLAIQVVSAYQFNVHALVLVFSARLWSEELGRRAKAAGGRPPAVKQASGMASTQGTARRLQRHGMSHRKSTSTQSTGAASTLDDTQSPQAGEDGMGPDFFFEINSETTPSANGPGSLSKGAAATAVMLQKALDESDGTLIRRLQQVPGLVMYPFWLCLVLLAGMLVDRISGKLCRKSELKQQHSAKDTQEADFVYSLAVSMYAVVALMQCSFLLFQISTKKRVFGSLVLFINLVALTTYIVHIYRWLQLHDSRGNEIQVARFLEWMTTTPVMITVLAAVGNSMRKDFISNWTQVMKIILWDEVMLVLGFIHTVICRTNAGFWAPLSFVLSCVCMAMVYAGIHSTMKESRGRAATRYETQSLLALEWFTYVLWMAFPIIHFLYTYGYISWLQYEVGSTFVDVMAKAVYSVTLLTGNFCILDVVSTLRIAQMRADRHDKRSQIIRSDAINNALQTAALEAEASARLARRFLANISHELRTPLNSVIAFNTLIAEDDDPNCKVDNHKEYAAAALTSAEALLGIISQVLDYAQLENEVQLSDNIHLVSEPFMLTDVCDQLADIVASRANLRKVDFGILVHGECQTEGAASWLLGDAFRLRQVLINMCDNAIKFAREVAGEVSLTISCVSAKTANEQDPHCYSTAPAAKASVGWGKDQGYTLTLQVSDNGSGIDPEKQYLLFKPFSQVHSDLSRKHGGTGLGLAITKSIIDCMGGDVKCESEGNGKGCIFKAQVPAIPVPKSSIPQGLDPLPELLPSLVVHVCVPRGPSHDMILSALRHWGVKMTDWSFSGLVPDSITLNRLMRESIEKGASAALKAVNDEGRERPVYVVDSSVFLKYRSQNTDRINAALRNTTGLVLGFLDEQDKLGKTFGDMRADGWHSLLRPLKLSVLRPRLAHACAWEARSMSCEAEHKDGQDSTGMAEGSSATRAKSGNLPRKNSLDDLSSNSKSRVLLVDDHPVNQKVRGLPGQDVCKRLYIVRDWQLYLHNVVDRKAIQCRRQVYLQQQPSAVPTIASTVAAPAANFRLLALHMYLQ